MLTGCNMPAATANTTESSGALAVPLCLNYTLTTSPVAPMVWVSTEIRRREPAAAQLGSLGDLVLDAPVKAQTI